MLAPRRVRVHRRGRAPRRVRVPHRVRRPRVRSEELFTDEPDRYAIKVASVMTITMLIANHFIRIQRFSYIEKYVCAFYFITAAAHERYLDHAARFDRDRGLNSIVLLRYEARVMVMFRRLYDRHFIANYPEAPLLRICIFAMNICSYIAVHDWPSWKTRSTIMLLARVIGGERFQSCKPLDYLERQAYSQYEYIRNTMDEIRREQFYVLRTWFDSRAEFMDSL